MDDHIYYGSLEQQERQRIMEERKQDLWSQTSKASTQATRAPPLNMSIPDPMPPPLRRNLPQASQQQPQHQDQIPEPSSKSEKIDRALNQYKQNKALRNLQLPTVDVEVKARLRQLGQPITFFGENGADRRDRLKLVMTNYYVEHNEFPAFHTYVHSDKNNDEEENEHFFYIPESNEKLQERRFEILSFSVKKAALRIEKQRLKRSLVDPVEEEKQIEKVCQDVSKFEVFMSQFGDSSAVMRCDFSRNNQFLSTAGGSGAAYIWNIPNCEQKTALSGHLTKAHDIQFHPESCIDLSEKSWCNLATASSDTVIRLWQFQQDKEEQRSVQLKGHEDRVNRVKFHQNGKMLFSTSHDCTMRYWDIETRTQLVCQTGHKSAVYALALHPDGSLVYTGDFGACGILWDLRSGKEILQLYGHVKNILCADFSKDGYHLITGGDDNSMKIWDIRRKGCIQTLPSHLKLISDVKFDPTNSQFFMSSSYDNTMKIWNAKNWNLVASMQPSNSKLTSLAISCDQKYLATTSLDRKWMLWKKNEKDIKMEE